MESRIQNTLKITFNDEKGLENLMLTLNRLNNLVHYLEQIHSKNFKEIDLNKYNHYLRTDCKIQIKFLDYNSICIVVISTDLIFDCLNELLTTDDIENALNEVLTKKLNVNLDTKKLMKALKLLRFGIKFIANIC
jgi:hypothetical protein